MCFTYFYLFVIYLQLFILLCFYVPFFLFFVFFFFFFFVVVVVVVVVVLFFFCFVFFFLQYLFNPCTLYMFYMKFLHFESREIIR